MVSVHHLQLLVAAQSASEMDTPSDRARGGARWSPARRWPDVRRGGPLVAASSR